MSDLEQGPAHARLSPSSAHRWMECPGSAQAAVSVPDVPTIYAAEGTMLHEAAAASLRREPWYGVGSVLSFDGFEFVYTEDHAALVDWCVQRVAGLVRDLHAQSGEKPELHVEIRMALDFIEPGCFGTSDVVICDYANRTLHVLDHKFGGGVKVFAAENPQLIAYGLGALDRYSLFDEFDRLVFGVLQPRLNHYDVEEITVAQANDWRSRFRAAAEATHAINAPLKAGDHCKFCPVKATCPELHTKALAAAQSVYAAEPTPPDALPEARIGEVLRMAPMIRAYLEAVEAEARRRLAVGLPVSGWKVVQGRGSRSWADFEKLRAWVAEQELFGALSEADAYEEPSLRSVAQMEKVCKKLGVSIPETLIHKTYSAPSVVPESDPRPSVAAPLDAIPDGG
jgi:hypothetical protein